jgi:hypothetical protein
MRSPERSRYRIIAASLRSNDIAAADRIVEALRDEGWPHANRSLVIREAVLALAEILENQSPEQIFRYFIEHRGRRLSTSVRPNGAHEPHSV